MHAERAEHFKTAGSHFSATDRTEMKKDDLVVLVAASQNLIHAVEQDKEKIFVAGFDDNGREGCMFCMKQEKGIYFLMISS